MFLGRPVHSVKFRCFTECKIEVNNNTNYWISTERKEGKEGAK